MSRASISPIEDQVLPPPHLDALINGVACPYYPSPDTFVAFDAVHTLLADAAVPDVATDILPAFAIVDQAMSARNFSAPGLSGISGDVLLGNEERRLYVRDAARLAESKADAALAARTNADAASQAEAYLTAKLQTFSGVYDSHFAASRAIADELDRLKELAIVVKDPQDAITTACYIEALTDSFWQGPMKRMIGVIALRQRWDQQTTAITEELLLRRLTAAELTHRATYWQQMTALATTYANGRLHMFKRTFEYAKAAKKDLIKERDAHRKQYVPDPI